MADDLLSSIADGSAGVDYSAGKLRRQALSGDVTVPAGSAAVVVNAITETSGPTSLVVGAFADGQLGKRSGATFIGVTANATLVGLGNVNNTSDANKPVSTAQQTALDLKANLASPTFTGTVVLPSGTVTLAMQANMATASLVYRKTAGSGAPEVNTLATLKTDLALTSSDVGLGSVTNDAQLKRAGADWTGFTAKTVPVGADTLLMEDSAASNAKKTLTIGTLFNEAAAVVGIGGAASGAKLHVKQGTITSAESAIKCEVVWNNGAVTFEGFSFDVTTNTASAAGSLLANLKIGGTSQWKVDKTGATTQLGGITATTIAGTTITGTTISGTTITGSVALVATPSAQSSGSATMLTLTGAADTAQTASTEKPDAYFNLARTVQFATGALTNQRAIRISAPTYGFAGSSTITTAATVSISGAPVAGTNATITNSYALRVEAGATALVSLALTGALTLGNNVISGVKTLTFNGEIDDGNSSTADTIDWSTGQKHKSTMTGNCTYTFTAPAGPCNLLLKLIQDGTGSRLATWPATVKWAGGAAPTLTTTATTGTDIVSFYYDGTNYWGAASANFA